MAADSSLAVAFHLPKRAAGTVPLKAYWMIDRVPGVPGVQNSAASPKRFSLLAWIVDAAPPLAARVPVNVG